MKMGVGGVSAKTSWRLEDLATAIDEHLRRAEEDIDEQLARVSRLRRARRNLELRMFRTSPLFCKTR